MNAFKFAVAISVYLYLLAFFPLSICHLHLSFLPPYQCFTVNSVKKHDSYCCNVKGGAWLEIKIMTVKFQRREEQVKTGYTPGSIQYVKKVI